MGAFPHGSVVAGRPDPGSRRLVRRLFASVAAVTITAGVLTPASASARSGRVPDTVAIVDGLGHFTYLSDLSPNARTLTVTFGQPGDIPLMGDWDCDGVRTPGAYRPSNSHLYLRNSNSSGVADTEVVYGNPGDTPIVGDFDGDGCESVAVYRSSNATAYVKNSVNSGTADYQFTFGNPGDHAFAGDHDADGADQIGLSRPSSGSVYLPSDRGPGAAEKLYFGNPGDQIVLGDWNGDGIQSVAAYRPSNGWLYFRNTNTSGTADGGFFVGRGKTVVVVSGVPAGWIDGPEFDPGAPAPEPTNPPPSHDTPVAPGFAAPPARAASGPIDVSGQSNVVIENLHISNPDGICVTVTDASNVVIRNSTIGPCGDEAVYLSDVDTATVAGNYVSGTGNGVLIHRSESVKVDGNAFVNAGRNFVQFDKVNGAGSSISGNRGQNELGGSNAEDLISVYMSNGTSSSPIRIVGNHLRNGGPSDSGSGIMLGDGGGRHQIVQGNVLVNPGQVGIGVASGSDVLIKGNLIYSSAVPWSNVGLYVWNQYGSACDNITVSGNQVNWTAAGGYANPYFGGGGCGDVILEGNDWSAPIGPGIF